MILDNDIIKYVKTSEVDYIQFKRLLNHKNINHVYILKTHDMDFRLRKDFR